MNPTWKFLHPRMTYEHLGLLPTMLWYSDPRRAAEQFHERYSYGGGWQPFNGFTLDREAKTIKYPGDPAYHARAETTFRDEQILFFDHSWIAIVQPDGSFEVSRMD